MLNTKPLSYYQFYANARVKVKYFTANIPGWLLKSRRATVESFPNVIFRTGLAAAFSRYFVNSSGVVPSGSRLTTSFSESISPKMRGGGGAGFSSSTFRVMPFSVCGLLFNTFFTTVEKRLWKRVKFHSQHGCTKMVKEKLTKKALMTTKTICVQCSGS